MQGAGRSLRGADERVQPVQEYVHHKRFGDVRRGARARGGRPSWSTLTTTIGTADPTRSRSWRQSSRPSPLGKRRSRTMPSIGTVPSWARAAWPLVAASTRYRWSPAAACRAPVCPVIVNHQERRGRGWTDIAYRFLVEQTRPDPSRTHTRSAAPPRDAGCGRSATAAGSGTNEQATRGFLLRFSRSPPWLHACWHCPSVPGNIARRRHRWSCCSGGIMQRDRIRALRRIAANGAVGHIVTADACTDRDQLVQSIVSEP